MTNLNLEVISRKQICKQIGISKDTIRNWINYRHFPKPLIASGRDPLFSFKTEQQIEKLCSCSPPRRGGEHLNY